MASNPTLPRFVRPSNRAGLAEPASQTVDVENILDADERVGFEVRDLRHARDMTLADLAEATGLSVGYLSQVERGVSSPSVKALHSISRAMGVTISWFFSPASEDEDSLRDIIVRAGNRRRLTFKSGITDELLSPNLRRQIELLRCVFPPGSKSGDQPYAHQGEEAGIVISGALRLWVDDEEVILRAGDSFAFESDKPHRYDNPFDEETIVIWAITPPSY
jgi:transcriptional regulator with XRE-family HTH domain